MSIRQHAGATGVKSVETRFELGTRVARNPTPTPVCRCSGRDVAGRGSGRCRDARGGTEQRRGRISAHNCGSGSIDPLALWHGPSCIWRASGACVLHLACAPHVAASVGGPTCDAREQSREQAQIRAGAEPRAGTNGPLTPREDGAHRHNSSSERAGPSMLEVRVPLRTLSIKFGLIRQPDMPTPPHGS